jgi:hypothetical protein
MDKDQVLAWLGRRRAWRIVEGMARYGIYTELRAFGVSMGTLLSLAKRIGKDHALATALWESGWYEARMLAALVDDAHRVTRRQMNAWAGDFDNWAICNTVCFHLFDRTPFASTMATSDDVKREEQGALAFLSSNGGRTRQPRGCRVYCVGLGDSGGLGNSPAGFLTETSSKSSEGTTNETNGPGISPKANSSAIMLPKGLGLGARNGDVYAMPSLPAATISLKLERLSSPISALRISLSRPS